jgi:hypothetical protein
MCGTRPSFGALALLLRRATKEKRSGGPFSFLVQAAVPSFLFDVCTGARFGQVREAARRRRILYLISEMNLSARFFYNPFPAKKTHSAVQLQGWRGLVSASLYS